MQTAFRCFVLKLNSILLSVGCHDVISIMGEMDERMEEPESNTLSNFPTISTLSGIRGPSHHLSPSASLSLSPFTCVLLLNSSSLTLPLLLPFIHYQPYIHYSSIFSARVCVTFHVSMYARCIWIILLLLLFPPPSSPCSIPTSSSHSAVIKREKKSNLGTKKVFHPLSYWKRRGTTSSASLIRTKKRSMKEWTYAKATPGKQQQRPKRFVWKFLFYCF